MTRLQTALVIAALVALAALTLFVVESAQARPLTFVLCHHKTGKASTELPLMSGFKGTGQLVLESAHKPEIVPLKDDKCTVIINHGSHATVVGSFEEVYCRIYGGYGCDL